MMSSTLIGLQVKNFRSLADVHISAKSINVLFGPNGSGKSTFLDTIWFVRDCAIRGVDQASSDRSHGIGALWDNAVDGENIVIEIETELAIYKITFGYSSGRIEPFVGETLYSKEKEILFIDRKIGSDKVKFFHTKMNQYMDVTLREPEKLAFTRYLDLEEWSPTEAFELDKLLHYIYFYSAREADLYILRKRGSESTHHVRLWERGQNLWSVLRNVHDRSSVDDRYSTIINFMRRAFPDFQNLLLEQTGPNSVYGNFIENNRREPIQASGVSDGHLQMLIHLTALFSEGMTRPSMILFDEPETSLHPYALAVLAEAFKLAAKQWNKQIFIATHSPVLISQFEPENILAAEIGENGQTQMRWVNEIEDIQDLLKEYAVGSLYMAEIIAPQSKSTLEETAE